MRERIGRGWYILLILLAGLVLWPSRCLAASSYQVIVVDDAQILTTDEEASLTVQATDLAAETGYDFMLVTTADAGGSTAREYAEDFYMDHYRQDDGVVCLVDMDNREVYIATSGMMTRYLTDDRIENILDDAYMYLTQADYAGAFEAMLDDIGTCLDRGIYADQYNYDEDTGTYDVYANRRRVTLMEGLAALVAGLLAGGGFAGSVLGRYRLKYDSYQYSYQGNSDLALRVQTDELVDRRVMRRRIPRNPSGGMGPGMGGGHSFGGGGHQSTIHTGSGGHSFGGGGRKF